MKKERRSGGLQPPEAPDNNDSRPQLYSLCLQEATLARSQGISVLPPRDDATKAPLAERVPAPAKCMHPQCVVVREAGKRTSWIHRQHRRAGMTNLNRWYLEEQQEGLGVVCGLISGDLLLFEFEGRSVEDGTFDEFPYFADEHGLGDLIGDIREGYEDRSPSGGLHWLVFCDDPTTQVLASARVRDEDGKDSYRPLIETKGEGGYAICAPTAGSVHPSGDAWVRLQGGFDSIVTLTPDEVEDLFSLARMFDQKPRLEVKQLRAGASGSGRPGDDFNERSEWTDILEPFGWKSLYADADGREHWCRPGKEPSGTSATITPEGDLLYVFSTSTPFDAERSYSKFSAYAVLNHSDDRGVVNWKEAAAALRQGGYGSLQGPRKQRTVVLTCMADVKQEDVEWCWEGRIPYGNVTIIAGNPGQGKSMLTIELAARKSRGRKLPFTPGKSDPISVILLTAEDGVANTVLPRLEAAGADMKRVYVLEGSQQVDGEVVQLISIPDDVPLIRNAITEKGARLVIVDVLDAFLADNVNAHQSHSIRRALTPLKMLAEETGAAIVLVCHLNKNVASKENPLYRVGGSIGNTGAARSVLLVAPDPEDEESRILAPIKANLAPLAKSLAFHLADDEGDSTVHIKWDGLSELTKDDLLTAPRAKAKMEATKFLQVILSPGPMAVKKLEMEAESAGIAFRTLRRAAEQLDIVKVHIDPPRGHWEWSLVNEEEECEGGDG